MLVKLIRASLNLLDRLLQVFALILFAIMAVSVFWQVISRYLTEQSSTWTGEVATASFVWLSMIAIALGVRRGRHMVMDLWSYFPNIRWLDGLVSLIALLGTLIVLWLFVSFGIEGLGPSFQKVFPGIGVAYGWMTLAVPVGFACSMLFAVEAWWIKTFLHEDPSTLLLFGETEEDHFPLPAGGKS